MTPTQLHQLADLLTDAHNIAAELARLRESQPDPAWEAQQDSPFGDLLCLCLDLEATLDNMGPT